ncbi:MAG: hypothetical protein ACK4RT_09035 [Erythrobacter sp.]
MKGPALTLGNAAARLVGCRFRLHGLDPATGLDCVGLVHASLAMIGLHPIPPRGYGLRNVAVDQWLAFAARSGLMPAGDMAGADEVLLASLGYGQHHLMISTGPSEVIHAHAGLARVVRQPRDPAMCIIARWQVPTTAEG